MTEQQSMFTPTPEEAAASLLRFWEQFLAVEFAYVEAAEGVKSPTGMVPALARIMAETQPSLAVKDETLGRVLLLMGQAYEAGVLHERANHLDHLDHLGAWDLHDTEADERIEAAIVRDQTAEQAGMLERQAEVAQGDG